MKLVVMQGVKIGKGAIIDAGSVVVHDIPINMIVAVNPCKNISVIHKNDSECS